MIDIAIPGFGELKLANLVLDFNGTLAVDGKMLPGVFDRLSALSSRLGIHVVTADTFGLVRTSLAGLDATLTILAADKQDEAKLNYVRQLGSAQTGAVGNGRNDRLMLKEAALGIGVILGEGASSLTLSAADVVCTSIGDALDLLTHPLRLTATLRS
jgi:soluble P-type ATPase